MPGPWNLVPPAESLDCGGRAVFVRCDFNVPGDAAGAITDDTRIRAALPTLRRVLRQARRVTVASHRGRPRAGPEPRFSLAPVARRLEELLEVPVTFVPDLDQDPDQVTTPLAVLENLRCDPGEKGKSPAFAEKLARWGEVYVNEAFAVSHRGDASIGLLPGRARAVGVGELFRREVDALDRLLRNPPRPFLVILGGAKVSDKTAILENMIGLADRLVLGGALAYPFLKAREQPIGASRCEAAGLESARKILSFAGYGGKELVLPGDHVAAPEIGPGVDTRVVPAAGLTGDLMGGDIGPETVERCLAEIGRARTILANGPLGAFEYPPFAEGTRRVYAALAAADAMTVIGGGDSLAALEAFQIDPTAFDHVSTGGGAMLHVLSGAPLPGLEALKKAARALRSGAGPDA